MINDGRIDLWLASEFNPIGNVDTSNPYWIFGQLEQAAKKTYHNEKTKDLQANLLRWVQYRHEKGMLDNTRRAEATARILDPFQDDGVRPVVFAVMEMDAERREQPDEYRAADVCQSDTRVRQILPWQDKQTPEPPAAFGAPAKGW